MSLTKINIAVATMACLLAACSSGSGSGSKVSTNSSSVTPSASTSGSNTSGSNTSGSNTSGNNTSGNNTSGNNTTSDNNFLQSLKKQAQGHALDITGKGSDFKGDKGFNRASPYTIKINGKTYQGIANLDDFQNGLQNHTFQDTFTTNDGRYTAKRDGTIRLYKQKYSVVAGMQANNIQITGEGKTFTGNAAPFDVDTLVGSYTQTLPSAGIYNYAGLAFNQNEQGSLKYSVNFDKRVGSGSITGLQSTGKITLNEGSIKKMTNDFNLPSYGIESSASVEKDATGQYKYGVAFFGPNAEEIAGLVDKGEDTMIGFGGSKQ